MRAIALLSLFTLLVITGCARHHDSLADETQRIDAWRQQRAANLTGENGWLTLAGLFWLKPGSNSFGSDVHNQLMLQNSTGPANIGTFELAGNTVTFSAAPDAGVTVHDKPITQVKLRTDASDDTTILAVDSLRFFAIERGGQFGIRVRDIDHPARKNFKGLDYFPISTDWRVDARYERYKPGKHIAIVNILGMTEQMESPGALVFEKDGKTWRLDAVRESAGDKDLFIMLTDATSGRDTYGAGRYLYVRAPMLSDRVWLDFNQAFNPPCAFTEFATCPLPPKQNRLSLAITAGEKKYSVDH